MKQEDKTNLTAVEEATPINDAVQEADNSEESASAGNAPQLPPNVEKRVKNRWWISYLITFIVHAVIAILVAWLRGCFTETDTVKLLNYWCDAFFVPGVLGTGFGLIVVASNGGTFDMLSYGFKSIFRLLKKDPIDRKYGGFYGYRKAREASKRSFWYLIIVGGLFLLISLILLVVYFQMS